MMSICDWMSDELLEHLSPKLLKDRPNTYTFTKALAENLVEEYSDKLPIAIVRPSVITGEETNNYIYISVLSYHPQVTVLSCLSDNVLTILCIFLRVIIIVRKMSSKIELIS